ncbi:MAG: TonB-dependent receptor plug domain-containing protein [Desulfatibacillaceae bacterium]
MQRKLYILLALLLAASMAAVPNVLAEEEESERLDPVVVTATKTPKSLENVPAVVTIIGPEEIEATPARTVGDLLADLPGVYPYEPQGSGLVTPQSVNMRGIGFPGHTLILLDGQKINTPFTDYAYLTTIPVRAVARVEVIRGPFSALYGSSAGGGIINIITRDGGGKTWVEPWAKAGDFGRRGYGLDAGIDLGRFSLGMFFDYMDVDNYLLYDDKGVDDRNRDYEHCRFHGKLTGTLGDSTNVSLSGGVADGDTGSGIGDQFDTENYQDVSHPYVNLQVESFLSDEWELRWQADWFRSDHKYHGETLTQVNFVNVGPPPPAPPVMVPQFTYEQSMNDTVADRYHTDLNASYTFLPGHIATAGVELVHTTAEKRIVGEATGELLDVQGRTGTVTDEDETTFSLYAQYDVTFLEDFELVLGGRFDDYETYGSEFSPKATFRWHYAEGGNLKLSAGQGFKAPNLNQLYSVPWSIAPFIVYQGNPDLDAETLWSYEVSLEQRLLDNRLFFRVSPYYSKADDFITSVREPDANNPGGQIMFPDNVDEVEIRGVDVEAALEVLRGLTLYTNYNYNDTRDERTDTVLNGYPHNSAALGARFNQEAGAGFRLFGSYNARYRGEWRTESWGNPPAVEDVGDYWYHTAALGASWREMVTLSVDVFNLYNDRTKTDIDRYLPERSYLTELSFRYEF